MGSFLCIEHLKRICDAVHMSTEFPERVDVKDVDWYTSFCQVSNSDIIELHCNYRGQGA